MPITLPQYTLTAKEEEGLLWAQEKYNAEQLSKTPPGPTKAPIPFWAMVARRIVNGWYQEKYAEEGENAKKAVIDAHPHDIIT